MLDEAIPNMAVQPISDTLAIVTGAGAGAGDINQIAEGVLTELQSLRVVPTNYEGGNDDDQGINIEQGGENIDHAAGENVPTHVRAMQVMARAILIVGMATVIVDGRTALYKPASGVVFGHNKLGYVITLAVIFTFGVAAIFAGIWISMFGLTYRRGFWIAGIVLFLSIWPLIGILSIGGLA